VHTTEDRALRRAQRLRAQGVAEHNSGRPAQALVLFRRGMALLEPRDSDERRILFARLSVNAASSESELRGLDAGLALLTEIEQAATADPVTGVYLHLGIGYMRARGGQFEAGLQHLDESVRLLEHADPVAQTNILMNRGMAHLFLGHVGPARRDYARAIELARAHQLVLEEAKLTHNLGEIEFYAGNHAVALQLMDASTRLEADWSVGVTLVDRARVLLEVGLHSEADEALQEAGRLFRRDRLFKDVAEVELARAECALLESEVQAARRLAAQARDRFRRRRNDSWRRNAELVLLQADLAAGRPGRRIAAPARRLAAEFATIGLAGQARLARLIEAEAMLAAGQPERAAELIPAAAADDSISVRMHARFLQAAIADRLGDRGTARRQARRGLAELSAYQARFGSIDLQTASAVHGRRLAELDLGLALRSRSADQALDALERARATSNRLVAVRQSADEEVTALLGQLRQTAMEVREAESAGAVAVVAEARARIAELQRRLRSRAWTSLGSGSTVQPAGARTVRSALAERGRVMLSYAQLGDQLSVVVHGLGRPRIHPLGSAAAVAEHTRRLRADLDVLAGGRLTAALLSAVQASLTRTLNRLDELLVRPVGVGAQALVIVPTGPLTTLAWTLLPSLVGRPVVVAPSATAWLGASRRPVTGEPVRIRAFAGPELDRAQEEVKAIGAAWQQPDAVSEVAEPDELIAALAGSSVVHVAAHGQHQPENPLFSSIRLSAGPVFAYDLDQRPPAAEHVVLSACELGQATIRPGDEALGLTSVLLHLGSRSVISGVARVHDGVAAELMPRYHQALAAGQPSDVALAAAIESSEGLPAPFVCFGAAWSAQSAPSA